MWGGGRWVALRPRTNTRRQKTLPQDARGFVIKKSFELDLISNFCNNHRVKIFNGLLLELVMPLCMRGGVEAVEDHKQGAMVVKRRRDADQREMSRRRVPKRA